MPTQVRTVLLVVLLVLLLSASRGIASLVIDYHWWEEMGQRETWLDLILYRLLPGVTGTVLLFLALWVSHASGLRFAGIRRPEQRWYRRLALAALAVVAVVFGSGSLDAWTVMTYFGSRGTPAFEQGWRDPVFGRPLPFYLFALPFYSELLGFLFTAAVLSILVFWATARGCSRWNAPPALDNAAVNRG